VLDWSYSNLSKLYDIGYAAGLKFYDENEKALRGAALMSAPRPQVRAAKRPDHGQDRGLPRGSSSAAT
jgi:hypothetical protein